MLALASSAVYLGVGRLPPTAIACTIAAIFTLTVAHRVRTPKRPANEEQPRNA